ncbi:MAG TPA: di-heme oxidoredictase family protein [Polyangiaceae bacterium]|nr:di-heme oxidoredictase family protein [Polyangiaceae bacterium]
MVRRQNRLSAPFTNLLQALQALPLIPTRAGEGLGLMVGLLALACSSEAEPAVEQVVDRPIVETVDTPLPGIGREFTRDFNDGDLAFSTPLHAADGLGPLYTRASCAACHDGGLRGPGLVQKMSVVEADGVTPAADQGKLAYGHTVHPLTSPAGELGITPPVDDSSVKISERLGPAVIGRGYMEAVLDSEIERVAEEQAARTDEIHGRVNRLPYASEPNVDKRFHDYKKGDLVIGRFGLKARIATLDDFTADAFQGDMGITSPLRPDEFKNPNALEDRKPGVDVSYASVNMRANYVRVLEIPTRRGPQDAARLFQDVQCAACHVPSLRTRADYPIDALADIDAPIYTDLLIHNMGEDLADGLPAADDVDGQAGSFDWRTAPLIGLRFNRTFLHDGRAKSVEEAILMHRGVGSEANDSVARFEALSERERALLVSFVESL